MITLSEAHLKELEAFIQDLPVKYGLPLINFLNKVAKESVQDPAGTASLEDTISED
jgi:hypothetical protein